MATKKKKRSGIKRVTVVGKRKRRTSRSVGFTAPRRRRAAAKPAPRRRKRKSGGGFLGATTGSKLNSLKSIGMMAIGVGTGAAITHVILRPITKRLVAKWPAVGKFMAAGEIFLGGMMAISSKKNFVKSVGVGILAGGVHGLMKQLKVYERIPGISGPGDFTEVQVPISGSFQDMISGILDDSRREVRTATVAGMHNTATVADTSYTETVSGNEWEDNYAYPTKG